MIVKRALAALVLSAVIIASLVAVTGRALYAQGAADEQSVLAKLDEVLTSQRAILAELEALKEELRIIKIRVTQQQ